MEKIFPSMFTLVLRRRRYGSQTSSICIRALPSLCAARNACSEKPVAFIVSFQYPAPILRGRKLNNAQLATEPKRARSFSLRSLHESDRGGISSPSLRLAVLIDGDNAQAAALDGILAEVGKRGKPKVKRVYADWTSSICRTWRDAVLDHSLQQIQQLNYTSGKNATDMALTIDAMDLLHDRVVDGFCLVSSDSDFTPLAFRLKAAGLLVIGFGKMQTPKAFVAACDEFIYTETFYKKGKVNGKSEVGPRKIATPSVKQSSDSDNLGLEDNSGNTRDTNSSSNSGPNEDKGSSSQKPYNDLYCFDASKIARTKNAGIISDLLTAMKEISDENGWSRLDKLEEMVPSLCITDYGFQRWEDFLESTGVFEIRLLKYRKNMEKVLLVKEASQEELVKLDAQNKSSEIENVSVKKWTTASFSRCGEFMEFHFRVLENVLTHFRQSDESCPYFGWTLLSDVANTFDIPPRPFEIEIHLYGHHDWQEFVRATGKFEVVINEETKDVYVKVDDSG